MPKLRSTELTDYEKAWIEAVRLWKIANPPDFAGYWYCVIGGGALTDGKSDSLGGLPFNLGHDESRARNRSNALNTARHRPICPYHNRGQGSKTFAEYRATNPRKRCGY